MFSLLAGSFLSKLVIAGALAGIAMFAVGSVIDGIGKGAAYERELQIRAAVAENDAVINKELTVSVGVHRVALDKANVKINALEKDINESRRALPPIPEDISEIKQCPKLCRF